MGAYKHETAYVFSRQKTKAKQKQQQKKQEKSIKTNKTHRHNLPHTIAVYFLLLTELTPLSAVSPEHPEVEDACVEMLLQLAPLKPPTVFSVIQEWSTARQNPIPRQLKDRITSLRNLIKARVPCLNLDQFL